MTAVQVYSCHSLAPSLRAHAGHPVVLAQPSRGIRILLTGGLYRDAAHWSWTSILNRIYILSSKSPEQLVEERTHAWRAHHGSYCAGIAMTT